MLTFFNCLSVGVSPVHTRTLHQTSLRSTPLGSTHNMTIHSTPVDVTDYSDFSGDYIWNNMDGSYLNQPVSPADSSPCSTRSTDTDSYRALRHQPSTADVVCMLTFDESPRTATDQPEAVFSEQLVCTISSCVTAFLWDDSDSQTTKLSVNSSPKRPFIKKCNAVSPMTYSMYTSVISKATPRNNSTRPATIGQSPVRAVTRPVGAVRHVSSSGCVNAAGRVRPLTIGQSPAKTNRNV